MLSNIMWLCMEHITGLCCRGLVICDKFISVTDYEQIEAQTVFLHFIALLARYCLESMSRAMGNQISFHVIKDTKMYSKCY